MNVSKKNVRYLTYQNGSWSVNTDDQTNVLTLTLSSRWVNDSWTVSYRSLWDLRDLLNEMAKDTDLLDRPEQEDS